MNYNPKRNLKIATIVNDPVTGLIGYSFIFQRLFCYMAENYPQTEIKIITNEGCSSKFLISNQPKLHKFYYLIDIKVSNYYLRGIAFIVKGLIYLIKNRPLDVIVVNQMLPEVFCGAFLKLLGWNVFCVVYDLEKRPMGFGGKVIHYLGIFFIICIGRAFFVNKYDYDRLGKKYRMERYLVGLPVFSKP